MTNNPRVNALLSPVVESIILSNTTLVISETSTVTITFSEIVNFSNADVTVQNGSLSTSSMDGGVTWTALFTPNVGVLANTNVITVGSSYTDLVGNPGSAATSLNYIIDTM